jgi:hypothetical protein
MLGREGGREGLRKVTALIEVGMLLYNLVVVVSVDLE